MRYLMLLLPLLLLPISARADDVYHIRPMSERELMATYQSVILDACRHAEGEWHEWSADPKGGYWGNAVSDGNEGIRTGRLSSTATSMPTPIWKAVEEPWPTARGSSRQAATNRQTEGELT